ncbi:MAG TPA: protein kinase [Povalibacter sp.]|uniref:serine/threonine-protein kinase n=1 Tax=Povalibacter sp. TaxID=1962978 RepID=UPI002C36934F|nr:protein kinase [Povalibacter sp.]HMN45850.1 protein kinase [Povalibacter sp.]
MAVSHTIEQLLVEFARGTLDEAGAVAGIERLVREEPSQARVLIARVQSDVVAGRLTNAAGRALLAGIERTVRELADRTVAMAEATEIDPDTTSMRPPTVPATRVAEPTQAVTPPFAKTLVRPEPSESDDTQMRPGGDTLRMPPPTQVSEPTVAQPADPDATLRTERPFPPTAARTVQMELGTQAMAGNYTATLQSSDKTQVISERLVQSLDEVDEPRHGVLQPGSIIKRRFVLESLLGKGGMGLVFGAIDRRKEEAQDPNPRVALKVLNADFERHPQSFIALQREARKAQTLAHPNVVTVFDFDRDGDTVYMTMELLKGRPLEAIVREARGKGVKPEVALPIIRGIAEGLAYAHRKGIVHSDLKPGNVFIGEDGTPKILDFGIARAVPSSITAENKDDVFDAGSLGAYTEAYATDEMIDGVDPHPADDLYALGIIGYELITGFHPYQRHGAPAARKLGIKPPPLKGLKLREARALERCLSFDRKQRPKDAGEFLKLFRGVSTLQKVSIAVAAVLAITAGYLWYQNYLETSPAIPFAQLPQETQQGFLDAMNEGDKAWTFFRNDGNSAALNDAIEFYAAAYSLHPRNRDAVKALRKAGDAMLDAAGTDAERRREAATYMQGRSDYFLKYSPVVEAAK